MGNTPFLDPKLTKDDVPEEDLRTLSRLAGEHVRAESKRLREVGIWPPKAAPKPAGTKVTDPNHAQDSDDLGR